MSYPETQHWSCEKVVPTASTEYVAALKQHGEILRALNAAGESNSDSASVTVLILYEQLYLATIRLNKARGTKQ